jgi:uroporphyrinogen-III synthase
MRLLVTRPEPDATRTAGRLRELGHSVLVEPLLSISFSPAPAGLPAPGALIVTSQNGLRALASWPQAAAWRGLPLFVAGPATGRAAREFGFSDVRTGASDAGTLAAIVIAARPRGPLIYAAARDRAGALGGGLAAAGYDVRVVEAYRAEIAPRFAPEVREALAGHSVDGVLLYSRRTAAAFRDLAMAAGIRFAGLTMFALSAQVAEMIPEIPARIAPRPDEDALLALIPRVGQATV